MDSEKMELESALHAIWYFGYGSNMKLSVMQGRGIIPLEVRWARVPGYVLTFDVFGLPYSEPSMASIARYTRTEEEQQIPDVCGVAYLLSRKDFKRLIGSEGGGVAYEEIEIEGDSWRPEGTEQIRMRTLVAKFPWRPNACPSKRYLTLLREGAQENNLPKDYVRYLDRLSPYIPAQSKWYQLGSSVFLWFGRKIVARLAKGVKGSLNSEGQCPKYWSTVIVAVYSAMWGWHDWVHAPLFGRGDGGKIAYPGIVTA